MKRRDVLTGLTAAGLGLLLKPPARAAGTDSTIEIVIGERLGPISPNIYGHFTEHIGGVIYDGVWVGPNSKIPNINGIRKELVEALRRIKVPVIRWPGGCFADSYDWRDGIGPSAKRPVRTNYWETDPDARRLHDSGPQVFEANAFGTDEFVRFCRLSGAKPYLAANLRSLSALDFDHWVEYCNSPAGSTSYADLRASGGSAEPFNVQYWGVGNESWGCGGNFRPEDYAAEFRRFTNWVPTYGQNLYLIAAGPNDADTDWTRRFFQEILAEPHAYHNPHFRGWSIHHYSRTPRREALRFGMNEWYALLRSADAMERIILDNWEVMGDYDRQHLVKLVVDEYGPWYAEGTEIDPSHIFGQQVTIRDALVTALTLDCFNRHPEKVDMANCAQLINNLNALFLAREDKFWATPNLHVFQMYAAHQDGMAVRAIFKAPGIQNSGDGQSENGFWGLKGSASLKGKVLHITAVNPSTEVSRSARIVLRGAKVKSAAATVLRGAEIHAHNTYEQPNAVQPSREETKVDGGDLYFTFPAASVTSLELELS